MRQRIKFFTVAVFVTVFLSGCLTAAEQPFQLNESQVELRSIQTRAFDTFDTKMMLQTIISTLQDLGFVIDKADLALGSVSGSKYTSPYYGAPATSQIKMTVTVRPRGESQLLVRVNAQHDKTQITDAENYQDFYSALEKALFLTAQQVE